MMTVAQVADRLQVSQSLVYRLVSQEVIECYRVGKAGIRFSWEAHIVPYLERTHEKTPRPQSLSGKKVTLKHLDLS